MGAMLVIGMGPARKAGEDKTSPAPSTEKKGSIVKLPASLLSIDSEEGATSPEPGDEVELTGTVEKVEGDIFHIRISDAMVDQEPKTDESQPDMSEEDKMRELARKADEENA